MPNFLVFTGLVPKLFGAKIILDIHDPMLEVFMSKFPGPKKGWQVAMLHLEEKISTSFADAVITANPHFQENLILRGVPASKITVINNLPDPDIFNRLKYLTKKAGYRDRFTLIFPGTIAPRYGLDVAIKAMPLLRNKIQNIRLLIIGKQTRYANSLILLADRLDVSSLVEFMPGIPNNEVPEQLAQADIGIYPALPDPHMSIATPGKVLEFAAMGIPIISSRLRIVEEMFDDSAVMFFEPGNIDQFVQCVLRLYNDPKFREKLVQQADQIFAQRHLWGREIQAYLGLLKRLLPERIKIVDLDKSHQ